MCSCERQYGQRHEKNDARCLSTPEWAVGFGPHNCGCNRIQLPVGSGSDLSNFTILSQDVILHVPIEGVVVVYSLGNI